MSDINNSNYDHVESEIDTKFKQMSTVQQIPVDGDEGIISPVMKQPAQHFNFVRRDKSVEDRQSTIADHYKGVLDALGEDPDRQGLRRTPERAAKAMMYFTKGYREEISGRSHSVLVALYHMQ